MRKTLIAAIMIAAAVAAEAKDIKTVVFTPSPKMTCESCEKEIKSSLRYEKGVKKIDTDLDAQTITVSYDSDKITEEQLTTAISKSGYTVANKDSTKTTTAKKGCCGASGTCKKAAAGSCASANKSCGSASTTCEKANASCEKAAASSCDAAKKSCDKASGTCEKASGTCSKAKNASSTNATMSCCKEKASTVNRPPSCKALPTRTTSKPQR